jgi:hypothetical protein
MTLRTRNRLMAFSVIAAPFIFLLGLLLFWDAEPLPPIPPLPNPNGYEDLVKAGNMVSNDFDNYDGFSSANLRELINEHAEVLQTAESGLQQKCRVPLDYSPDPSAFQDRLAALKRLAHAFVAEGRLAEMENRPGDAARFYLDTIHLGNESSRGGALIDQLVGTAIEAVGVANLQKAVGQLDAKTCCETAVTLETLDAQRQTWDDVMQQERDWSRRTFTGIRYELVRLMDRHSLEKIFQNAEQHFEKQQSQTRQLIIDLAARAYELDKGHRPTSVTDLVPDYLKAIPQDPFSGTNMVYSP